MSKSSFIIAGTDSGSGKTTVTVSILNALGRRGLAVQAFKVGPDYIDPTYHNLAAPNQRSRNLDLWLCPEPKVKQFYARAMSRAQVGVVEGVMGLFDGKVERDLDTSTAALAKILDLPVILVIDASRMAQSIGAYLHGFIHYDRDVKIRGVILNRLSGEGHFQFLKNFIESRFPVSVFGWLANDEAISIPERHLGLVPSQERELSMDVFEQAAKTIDIEGLLDRTVQPSPLAPLSFQGPPAGQAGRGGGVRVRLGLARDKAFHFYYEDALEELENEGFEIIPFSPLNDSKLPRNLDVLYFGGGFPEVFTRELSENIPMIESIRAWTDEKKPLFAECGGLMYLVSLGLIPGRIQMTNRLQNFGYKEIVSLEDSFLFSRGERIRVHEFHYSVWDRLGEENHFAFQTGQRKYGFWNGHILASYFHCHLGAYPEAIRRLHEIQTHENLYQNR